MYSVTVTSNNCTSPPFLVNVIVNPLPLANASNAAGSTYCSGDSISLVSSGGSGYSWSGPAGFSSTTQNPVISPATVTMAGTYTVTVTTSNGCVSTDTTSLLVNQTPPEPTVSAVASTICEGDNLLLSSSSTGAGSFSWTGPDGFLSGVQNPTIPSATLLASGTYIVIASSSGCLSNPASITVTVNPNPVATASVISDTICSGNSINLSSGGGGTYAWTGPGAFSSSTQNPVIGVSTISNNGTYTVIVSNAGCSDTASVSVIVNLTPNAAIAGSDTTCVGDTLILNASGSGTINWYSDASLTTLLQAGGSTYSPTLAPNTTGTYFVTVTGSNGCVSASSTVTGLNYDVVASASASPFSGFIPLNVVFTNSSTGVDASDNYSWEIGGTPFSTAYNSTYTFNTEGNYIVTLIVTDAESGCMDTATVNIFADGQVTFSVPNVFTPNNDNSNDVFQIISNGLIEVHVMIYDRWGLKMFEFDGVQGSWDGRTTAGVEVSDGTYFYLFSAKGADGKEYKAQGNLLITR